MDAAYHVERANVKEMYLSDGHSLGKQMFTLCFYRQMWQTFMDKDNGNSVDDTQSWPRANYWEPTGSNPTYQLNQLPKSDYGLYVEVEKCWSKEIGFVLRKMGILNPNTPIQNTDVHCLSILNPNMRLKHCNHEQLYRFMSPSGSQEPVITAKNKAKEENTEKANQMVLVPEDAWIQNDYLTWNGFAMLFATKKWYEERFKKKIEDTDTSEIFHDTSTYFSGDPSLAPYLLTILTIQGRTCKPLNDYVWSTYQKFQDKPKAEEFLTKLEKSSCKRLFMVGAETKCSELSYWKPPPILNDAWKRRYLAVKQSEEVKNHYRGFFPANLFRVGPEIQKCFADAYARYLQREILPSNIFPENDMSQSAANPPSTNLQTEVTQQEPEAPHRHNRQHVAPAAYEESRKRTGENDMKIPPVKKKKKSKSKRKKDNSPSVSVSDAQDDVDEEIVGYIDRFGVEHEYASSDKAR